MKILARYVFDMFLTAFLLSFLVISAVLTIGLLVPIAGYFIKGAGLPYLTRFLAVGFHEMLQLTLPISLFFSSVFVFARLASDGELDAMHACGLRLWYVAAGPLVLSAVLSGTLLWVNGELMPREHEVRRRLKAEMLISSGFDLVEPGETIVGIPGMRLRFDARDGESLVGLTVQDTSDPQITRLLTAGRAKMRQNGMDVTLALENMQLEPLDAARTMSLRARRFNYYLKDAFKAFRFRRHDKDMPTAELLKTAYQYTKEFGALVPSMGLSAYLEFGRRIVYALAPLCFVLMGVGLGSRARRGGLVRYSLVALAVLLGYYISSLLMVSLEQHPALHPDLFIYVAPLTVLSAGLWLMRGR